MVETEKVNTAFLKIGDTKVELLESLQPGGVISNFIEQRGEGIHHIASEVADIFEEVKRLENEGFNFINSTPHRGADNKLVCFLMPKTTNGVLVELCQEIQS
jgi:methylmalonyl-CoA/ethylmalonyl-CoA epimerase